MENEMPDCGREGYSTDEQGLACCISFLLFDDRSDTDGII